MYPHILCSSVKSSLLCTSHEEHYDAQLMDVECSKSRSISVRMLLMTAMGHTRFCTDPFLHV